MGEWVGGWVGGWLGGWVGGWVRACVRVRAWCACARACVFVRAFPSWCGRRSPEHDILVTQSTIQHIVLYCRSFVLDLRKHLLMYRPYTRTNAHVCDACAYHLKIMHSSYDFQSASLFRALGLPCANLKGTESRSSKTICIGSRDLRLRPEERKQHEIGYATSCALLFCR